MIGRFEHNQYNRWKIKRGDADSRAAKEPVSVREPGAEMQEQGRQQREGGEVKEIHQSVQTGQLFRAAIKIDDERREKPRKEVIGELGLTLLEKDIESDTQIDQPDGRQVKPKLP